MSLIESGSHTPGVRAEDFGLPAGTALRYERPAELLRGLLPSYAMLDSSATRQSGPGNWVLPGWARLWIAPASESLTVGIRNERHAPLGSAMLFGVTSRVMPMSTYGGVSVVVEIGPAAWARLFMPSAELLCDTITPLDRLLPQAWCEDLIARVAGCDRGPELKDVLDAFFLDRMPPPHPQEALIAGIAAVLADEGTNDLAGTAARLGIDGRTMLKLTKRYFGFAPKILLMRTRFLRALTKMLVDPGIPDFAAVPPRYHDVPHFLRDANRFLGMTPRRFLANPMPYTRAALRARLLVLAPTPKLVPEVFAPRR